VEPQRRFLAGLAAVNLSDNSGNSEIIVGVGVEFNAPLDTEIIINSRNDK